MQRKHRSEPDDASKHFWCFGEEDNERFEGRNQCELCWPEWPFIMPAVQSLSLTSASGGVGLPPAISR